MKLLFSIALIFAFGLISTSVQTSKNSITGNNDKVAFQILENSAKQFSTSAEPITFLAIKEKFVISSRLELNVNQTETAETLSKMMGTD